MTLLNAIRLALIGAFALTFTKHSLGSVSMSSVADAIRREERQGWDGPTADWSSFRGQV